MSTIFRALVRLHARVAMAVVAVAGRPPESLEEAAAWAKEAAKQERQKRDEERQAAREVLMIAEKRTAGKRKGVGDGRH